jgi:hypothetical protein
MVLGESVRKAWVPVCISACAFRDIRSDEGFGFLLDADKSREGTPTFDGRCATWYCGRLRMSLNRGQF